MPKFSVTVGDYSEVDPSEGGFQNYEGPVPPTGLYQTVVKLWRVQKNKNDDDMFMVLFEIDEPKGSEKAKYNGYAIFHYANLNQQGAPYVNAMLDVLGIDRKAVWTGAKGGIVTDPDSKDSDKPDVTKIGGTKVKGLRVTVTTNLKKPYGDPPKRDLGISTFASASGAVEDDVAAGDESYDDGVLNDDGEDTFAAEDTSDDFQF